MRTHFLEIICRLAAESFASHRYLDNARLYLGRSLIFARRLLRTRDAYKQARLPHGRQTRPVGVLCISFISNQLDSQPVSPITRPLARPIMTETTHAYVHAYVRHSGSLIEISVKIGGARKVLSRAEKCNGAYHCDKQRRRVPPAAARLLQCIRARARANTVADAGWLRTRGEPLLFPRENAYVVVVAYATKKRSGRDCGERTRQRKREREYVGSFPLRFFSFSTLFFHRSRAVCFFPSRNRSPDAQHHPPFVSHAKALITSFRVRRRRRSY